LKTVLHFGLGVYAAHHLRHHAPCHLHAHFVDRATVVALVAGRLLGMPYSVTAHANDIYVNPVLLPEKLAEAQFVATCTHYNETYLANLDGMALRRKLHCIYHGLDLDQYCAEEKQHPPRPLIISVGQLKEKKGFVYLLRACRLLQDRGYDFRCQIVGEGPLRGTLEEEIQRLGLADTVSLCGALPHQAVIQKYREAAVFVLPCVLGADGDRDGIPNVILEAMAMALPVVSTRHSGIPEVVCDGWNGLLTPPEDETAVAEAIASLLDNPKQRQQFGLMGRQTVVDKFSIESNVARLLAEFLQSKEIRWN
jgi:glycosyltransferase involved in cell wall biosynthesis